MLRPQVVYAAQRLGGTHPPACYKWTLVSRASLIESTGYYASNGGRRTILITEWVSTSNVCPREECPKVQASARILREQIVICRVSIYSRPS
jgi:hypothetical protein